MTTGHEFYYRAGNVFGLSDSQTKYNGPWLKLCFLGIHGAAVTTSGIFPLQSLEPVEYVLVAEGHRTGPGCEVQFLGGTAPTSLQYYHIAVF